MSESTNLMQATLADEQRRFSDALASLDLRTEAFINGAWRTSASGEVFDCVSPISGETIAEVAACDEADVDIAVRAARQAFESGRWISSPRNRRRVLLRLADLIDEHADELALLETIDMGKPISIARLDIPAVTSCIRYYAEALDKVSDEVAPTEPTEVVLVRRVPLGVVAGITPWNYPLVQAAWKIGPGLAMGNSMILKPAEQSPLSTLKLAELAAEAGVPDGVLQVVPGYGETAGAALGRHTDVDMIAFTGSTEVGKLLLQYSGESNMKRVALECGGKTPHIVLADCPDLDAAAEAAAWGIFRNQGEVCSAGSRLLVEESIKQEFMERVLAVSRTLVPGDPLDPDSRLGAIVDRTQLERVMSYIAVGQSEGATLRLGGHTTREETGGYYIEPTVFDPVDNTMRIAQEEIFGPVLATISFATESEAVAIANQTIYGLTAAVWTSDLNTAHRMGDRLRAGIVWVNTFGSGDMTVPFGGFKQSGFGRDRSLHAMDKYADLKSVWIHLS
jgi:acyl-CoA reductase-like NAD-dependent aldehyde dehydrogenase